MMIQNILAGKDEIAKNRLRDLFENIENNPKIAWFPSAGDDYTDIVELSSRMAEKHGIKDLPNLFIHTDYNIRNRKLTGVVQENEHIKVEVKDKFELKLTKPINFIVNPEYADFPRDTSREPVIYLLDLIITTDTGETIEQPIIYFFFENINFLDEILLRYNINVPYIVKVREGCGMGGCGKSISIAYAFLSELNTKYLIIDNEEHTDFDIVDQLKEKHHLSPAAYELTCLDSIDEWSGFIVNIFSVKQDREDLTKNKFKSILRKIGEKEPCKVCRGPGLLLLSWMMNNH